MDPEDEARSMLIQGRSRSSDHDKIDEYHRHNFCQHTKQAHQNTKTDIENNPERQTIWCELVWDESIALDNVILSGDPCQVAKKTNGVSHQLDGIKCNPLFVCWVIAKKNVGHRTVWLDW